jgi:hypothetical protein
MAHGRMASKLKRRIPVIFSGVGASAGSASGASVGVANIPPSWTDTLGDSFSVTAGVPFSYTFTAYDPNPGDLIDFIQNSISAGLTVTENDQSGLYRTITIASPGYPGGTGLTAGTYTASLDLDDVAGPEADWVTRTTGSGVVWAHRFNDQQTANFCDTPNDATHGTVAIVPTGGIIGDGCLRLDTPAGKFPGMRWARPLAPMVASPADSYPADHNGPGLVAIAPHTWYATTNVLRSRFANGRGGFFGHADYYDPTYKPMPYPDPPTVAAPEFVYAGPFWIQYRMKVSASRFATGEVSGKVMMLEALSSSSNSVEYVQGLLANNAFLPDGMYHYTNVGAQGFDAAENVWPADTWVTVMYKITPGQSGVANAGVKLQVAASGASSWTTLLDRTDILWNYSEGAGNPYPPANPSVPIPYGWNLFMFSTFNGGGQQTASVNGYTVDYDQVICSTAEIPLPVV